MKSLDSAKKAPIKRSKHRSSRKKNVSRSKNKKKKLETFPVAQQAKRTLMWGLVSGFMVIIVVGWVFFLRFSLEDDLSKRGGGLDEISKGFNRIFNVVDTGVDDVKDAYSELQELQLKLIEEEEVSEEVLELRGKVFPEFENANSNSNK
ncbi:hypothetical protein KKB10_05690 [Patescibacteria group bacterium]|nr:hypothetical protein [Patescibacteria group bacterium]MBU1075512.1 hypothetical protein [Patescibacteria group bacterium]MBU1952576.1 hypothetical protein [Patescibacteria group bacterium]